MAFARTNGCRALIVTANDDERTVSYGSCPIALQRPRVHGSDERSSRPAKAVSTQSMGIPMQIERHGFAVEIEETA